MIYNLLYLNSFLIRTNTNNSYNNDVFRPDKYYFDGKVDLFKTYF